MLIDAVHINNETIMKSICSPKSTQEICVIVKVPVKKNRFMTSEETECSREFNILNEDNNHLENSISR